MAHENQPVLTLSPQSAAVMELIAEWYNQRTDSAKQKAPIEANLKNLNLRSKP